MAETGKRYLLVEVPAKLSMAELMQLSHSEYMKYIGFSHGIQEDVPSIQIVTVPLKPEE